MVALLLLLTSSQVLATALAQEENPVFVIGAACSMESWEGDWYEGDLDVERFTECETCWPDSSLGQQGVEEARQCVALHMPNIEAVCGEQLRSLTPDGYSAGSALFSCFLDYVKERDVEDIVIPMIQEWISQRKRRAAADYDYDYKEEAEVVTDPSFHDSHADAVSPTFDTDTFTYPGNDYNTVRVSPTSSEEYSEVAPTSVYDYYNYDSFATQAALFPFKQNDYDTVVDASQDNKELYAIGCILETSRTSGKFEEGEPLYQCIGCWDSLKEEEEVRACVKDSMPHFVAACKKEVEGEDDEAVVKCLKTFIEDTDVDGAARRHVLELKEQLETEEASGY